MQINWVNLSYNPENWQHSLPERSVRFWRCTWTHGKKGKTAEGTPNYGVWGHAPSEDVSDLGAQKYNIIKYPDFMTKMLSQNKKCMDISAVCTGVCVNMGTKLLVCSQANRSQITLWPTRSTLESCWIYSSILMRDAVADGGTSGAGLGFSHTLPYWKDRGFCCFYQLVSSQPGKWAQDHSAMIAKLFLWKKKERGCKELHKECEGGWGLVGVGGGWWGLVS